MQKKNKFDSALVKIKGKIAQLNEPVEEPTESEAEQKVLDEEIKATTKCEEDEKKFFANLARNIGMFV